MNYEEKNELYEKGLKQGKLDILNDISMIMFHSKHPHTGKDIREHYYSNFGEGDRKAMAIRDYIQKIYKDITGIK